MTNEKEKADKISGLVKTIPFSYPAKERNGMLNPNILKSLFDFHRHTAKVFRQPFLSQPIEQLASGTTEELCIRALKAVITVLQIRGDLREGMIPFTLLDGTDHDQVIPSKKWGNDICFVNVFWSGPCPVISVVIAPCKWVRTQQHYHRRREENSFAVIFEYDYVTMGYGANELIRKAIINSTNYHHLKDFGTIIGKALIKTEQKEEEYPVAAAVYLNDVVWYADRPYRHYHIVHSPEYQKAAREADGTPCIQGFLTNHGNFINRYRAMYKAISIHAVINTPRIDVPIIASVDKQYHAVEVGMGGILQQEDMVVVNGYKIARYPLFSEDLW